MILWCICLLQPHSSFICQRSYSFSAIWVYILKNFSVNHHSHEALTNTSPWGYPVNWSWREVIVLPHPILRLELSGSAAWQRVKRGPLWIRSHLKTCGELGNLCSAQPGAAGVEERKEGGGRGWEVQREDQSSVFQLTVLSPFPVYFILSLNFRDFIWFWYVALSFCFLHCLSFHFLFPSLTK